MGKRWFDVLFLLVLLIITEIKTQTLTGCLELRNIMTRHAQTLGPKGVQIFIPVCKEDGEFEEIQCDTFGGRCWCVDKRGLEKPGTRVSDRGQINCNVPSKCANHHCRMYCQHGFELDLLGCPLCKCRDLCMGIKCPGKTTCQVEDIPCSEEVCPSYPTCKKARSLDDVCPFGAPFSFSDNKPLRCGLKPNTPQCPSGYACVAETGSNYGVCCLSTERSEKPGTCPSSSIEIERCDRNCSSDADCNEYKKCCNVDKCGKVCVHPKNKSSCFMKAKEARLSNFSFIFQCKENGDYEPRQCYGSYCWCVNTDGTQIMNSFGSKEEIKCEESVRKDTVLEELLDVPKSGVCPDNDDLSCTNTPCATDYDCEGDDKCCSSNKCGLRCVHPKVSLQPSICEHLRMSGLKLLGNNNESFAIPIPQCLKDGKFNSKQCDDDDNCWCVNEYGIKISDTYYKATGNFSCRQGRSNENCGGICRVLCTYGFERDKNGCEICECRDLCEDAKCPPNHICKLNEVECSYDWCPNVPMCVPMPPDICPRGKPLLKENNVLIKCDPFTKTIGCPNTYECIEYEFSSGICCPSTEMVTSSRNQNTVVKLGMCPSVLPWEAGVCVDQCQNDTECPSYQKCCPNGCGRHVCKNPEGFTGKIGQCPYNLSSEPEKCEFQCKSDYECKGDAKCCSNGCGTQCTEPLKMTACQHQKISSEERIKKSGIQPNEVYIPTCKSDGHFDNVQCDPANKYCWCVDNNGIRIPGTKAQTREQISCKSTTSCPTLSCSLNCSNGQKYNEAGCPLCECQDPCEGVVCKNPLEKCRIVRVNCITEPCPPLTLCLPDLNNPCPVGKPLTKPSGVLFTCGLSGNVCPSSHRCHISPLGEYSMCCPKPRQDCFWDKSLGSCKGSVERWHFSKGRQTCEKFIYSGCGGNLNNFESKEHCETTCPVTTSCEEVKKQAMTSKDEIVFVPKCNKKTGEWNPVQCLQSLGLCWCVNNKGTKIPGTAVRGTPACHKRRARKLEDDPICPYGEPVYICPKNLCDDKICFSHPKASCRINPCGGCHIEFYSETNQRINCNEGLTACHSEVQEVINSPAWKRQGISLNEMIHLFPKQYRLEASHLSHVISEASKEETTIHKEPSPPRVSHVTLNISPLGSKITFHTTEDQNKFTKKAGSGSGQPNPTVKFGDCPPLEAKMLERLIGGCGKSCAVDDDCPGSQKCCFVGCGLSCENPLNSPHTAEPVSTAHSVAKPLSVSPPTCSSEGGYSIVQKQDGLSWCVDKFGRPIHSTLTRGQIDCTLDGAIKNRKEYGPVCAGSNRPAKVCKDECLKAYCYQHPDAICKADPCDDCMVSFYNHKGQKLDCLHKCMQPMEKGHCDSSSVARYFYNNIAKRCEHFMYTGCGGNDNNFLSMQQCQKECEHPVPVCDQPLDTGTCRAYMPRWFYNKYTHRCEKFHFGGCGGNSNNFETRELCEARCPDSILCPWAPFRNNMKSCSRYKACVNKKCSAHPKSMCTVDPCSCQPYFVDSFGKHVSCDYLARGPLEIVAPPLTKETRCQNMRRRHLSKGALYVAQCTKDGSFVSKQCAPTPRSSIECWCVDESGKQLPNSASFLQNHGSCDPVKIDHVEVTLAFKHNSSYTEQTKPLIESAIRRFLKNISAQVGNVDLKVYPNNTVVIFKLTGSNKEHIAYQLEDMVKNGEMSLHSQSAVLPVDVRSSHFHHANELAPNDLMEMEGSSLSDSQKEAGLTMTAIVIVSVTGILLTLAILGTVVYRKRRKNFIPGDNMESKYQEARNIIFRFLSGRCGHKKENIGSRQDSLISTPDLQSRHAENNDPTNVRTITADSANLDTVTVRECS